jgi:hypothetical protein
MCRGPFALLALVLLAAGPSPASAQTWTGNGPFPAGPGSRTVNALAVDPATGTLYAGTGSGTVFAFGDASFSEAPEAVDDSAVTHPDVAIEIDVLANDTDPENALDTASIELRSNPGDGTATVNGDGTVTYTPDTGFVGTDSFSYTVRDQAGNESNEAFVSVRVNAPPTAGDDAASTPQDEPVTIDVLANDSDADGTLDPATVAMWNSPANGGTIVESDGRITYIPNPDFSGDDSFTYKVGDDDGGISNEATVSVTVTAVNDPPSAADDSATTGQDTAVIIDVLTNDSDADGTLVPATVTVQSAPGDGSATVNVDGTITYTPNADFSGTDTFTYTVEDNDGDASNAATVTVTVTPSGGGGNSPPVAANDSADTGQDTSVIIDVLDNDADADGTLEPATVAVQSAPGNGSATVNANGTVTYMPNADFSGTDTFTYTVEDDDGDSSNAATVTVTVTPSGGGNSPPTARDDTATTGEGTAVIIDVLANDSDDDGTLDETTVAVQDAPANGSTAVNGNGTISYTPDANFTGTDSFTYTVKDNAGEASGAATVTVSVTAASNPPPPPPSGGGGGGGTSGLLLLAALTLALGQRRWRVK